MENKKKSIIKLLEKLKAYSDEIPDRIIHSDTPYYKVRKGWWQSLEFAIYEIERIDLISQSTAEMIEKFRTEYCTQKFVARLTTKEDIDFANSLIDKLLKSLTDP